MWVVLRSLPEVGSFLNPSRHSKQQTIKEPILRAHLLQKYNEQNRTSAKKSQSVIECLRRHVRLEQHISFSTY